MNKYLEELYRGYIKSALQKLPTRTVERIKYIYSNTSGNLKYKTIPDIAAQIYNYMLDDAVNDVSKELVKLKLDLDVNVRINIIDKD